MAYPTSTTTPVARKRHKCQNYECFMQDPTYYMDDLPFSGKRALVRLRRDNGYIQPGEKYYRFFFTDAGPETIKADIQLTDALSKTDFFFDNE